MSLGASRSVKKHDYSTQHSVQLVESDRERLPMVLLLQDQHFSKLFALLHQLSNFTWDSDAMVGCLYQEFASFYLDEYIFM